jgi:hypothetical protein
MKRVMGLASERVRRKEETEDGEEKLALSTSNSLQAFQFMLYVVVSATIADFA